MPEHEADDPTDIAERGATPMTTAVITGNVGAFVGQVFFAGDLRLAALGIPQPILQRLGANASLWTIADTRVETLVTSIFLHASLWHLAFNMVFLWFIGSFVESEVGPARFLSLYVVSGVVGSAGSAIWGRLFEPTLSVGASGAICGLLGASLVLAIRAKESAMWGYGLFFLLALVLVPIARLFRGDIIQIDNAAHVTGTLAGIAMVVSWPPGIHDSPRRRSMIVALYTFLVGLSGFVVYARVRTDPLLFRTAEERREIAIVALRAGKCEEARQAIRRALAMDPHSVRCEAVAARIANDCVQGFVPPSSERLPLSLHKPS